METKAKFTDQIKTLSTKGVEWLEPFNEFVNGALSAHKIARAKTQGHDLLIMAKTVGSNFILKDKRLSAIYKKEGFAALSAVPGAGCAATDNISIQKLLPLKDLFCNHKLELSFSLSDIQSVFQNLKLQPILA